MISSSDSPFGVREYDAFGMTAWTQTLFMAASNEVDVCVHYA